jgi:hypothetical protein
VRREDFNGKTANAVTNGVGVSFMHHALGAARKALLA